MAGGRVPHATTQTAASRRGGQSSATPRAAGGNSSAAGGGAGGGGGSSLTCTSLSMSMALPSGGAATGGRWGQLDTLLGVGGAAGGRSPFPCSATRTPQHGANGGSAAGGGAGGGGGSRTPGSAIYSNRSHRGFSALLAFGGAGS